jgi:long-subunit acyl-CoA synthetase (AMP-forming)
MSDEAKSANYFDSEGFAEVGDVGFFDEEGSLFFEGRINDLIRFN